MFLLRDKINKKNFHKRFSLFQRVFIRDCLHDICPLLRGLLHPEDRDRSVSVGPGLLHNDLAHINSEKLFENQARVKTNRDFWKFAEDDLLAGLYWEELYNQVSRGSPGMIIISYLILSYLILSDQGPAGDSVQVSQL